MYYYTTFLYKSQEEFTKDVKLPARQWIYSADSV